jgi:hypothetical protein
MREGRKLIEFRQKRQFGLRGVNGTWRWERR